MFLDCSLQDLSKVDQKRKLLTWKQGHGQPWAGLCILIQKKSYCSSNCSFGCKILGRCYKVMADLCISINCIALVEHIKGVIRTVLTQIFLYMYLWMRTVEWLLWVTIDLQYSQKYIVYIYFSSYSADLQMVHQCIISVHQRKFLFPPDHLFNLNQLNQ